MRKIPIKNYIILLIIAIFTFSITFYLMNQYQTKDNKKINFVSEIKENELDSYITEGHEVIIYMSKSDTEEIEKFEKQLKIYTTRNDLSNKYVYLNLNNVSDNFYNEFYLKYIKESSNKFDIIEPAFIYIDDMKVIYYINNVDSIDLVKEFFAKIGDV